MGLRKNIVFIHIPKAGGTSVRSFIAKHVDKQDIFPEDQLHHFPRFENLDVAKPMLFMSHLGYDFARSADADAFVLLRHPIERLLSLYSYAINPGKNVPIISPDLVKGMSLTDFFRSQQPEIRMNIDNTQSWQIASGYSARHRTLRIDNGATMERIIAQAKRNLDDAAIVGTLENINDFYSGVSMYFSGKFSKGLQKIQNASKNRVMWHDLSKKEKGLVESHAAEEWAVYCYAKAIAVQT